MSQADHDRQARREEAVRAELDSIGVGLAPAERTFGRAPYLADRSWKIHPVYGVPVLWGRVQGHPRLGDGMTHTGRVWAVAVDRSWALTTSRYYRLNLVDPGGSAEEPLSIYEYALRRCPENMRQGYEVLRLATRRLNNCASILRRATEVYDAFPGSCRGGASSARSSRASLRESRSRADQRLVGQPVQTVT
jgi:hypothetical protein